MRRIPKVLYKYKAITDSDRQTKEVNGSYTKNLLTKGELYFSPFEQLNDPNEMLINYDSGETPIFISKDDLSKDLYKSYLHTQEKTSDGRIKLIVPGDILGLHVRQNIQCYLNYGVLCLTEDPINTLMYDYYAGGHKGICIGFEWSTLGILYKGTTENQLPGKIKYGSAPPRLDISGPNMGDLFFTKSSKYKHEKELRILSNGGVFPNRANVKAAIKEIIFGCAVSVEDQEMVIKWTSGLPNTVDFYKAYMVPKTYKLDCKLLSQD